MKHLLFFILILLLTGCQSSSDKEIRAVVLRGPSVMAFAQWLEQPPVIEGKRVAVTVAESPDIVQAALIKGEADIAVLPTISAANLYNKGVRLEMTGCPIWGTLYLVGRTGSNDSTIHIFGRGTTPDILTRHYLSNKGQQPPLNYVFQTAGEITQGLMAKKINRAVVSEPFLSIALRKDTTLRIIADLNRTETSEMGFAQTAIVLTPDMSALRDTLNSLLAESCRFANERPEETIRILEDKKLFAPGMLTPEAIRRCRLDYKSSQEAQAEIDTFLRLIFQYEPKAIGGKLPDARFITSRP